MEKILQFCEKPQGRLLIYILVSLIFRYPSLFIHYADIDEVMWGLLANAIVDGHIPYHEVMGEKPPLLYLTYAAIFSLFGKHNYFAMHLFGIVWTGLTAFFIHHLAARAHGFKVGVTAALASIIFAAAPGFRILATTGELLMNLPLVLSCIFFLNGVSKGRFVFFILAGMATACAALFRQQSLVQLGAFGVFLILAFCLEKKARHFVKQILIPGVALILGATLVVGGCLAYIVAAGAWEDFMIWVVHHNYSYIQSGFFNDNVWVNLTKRGGHFFWRTLPLWILGFIRFKKVMGSFLSRWSEQSSFEIFICLYLMMSLIAVLPGGRFFQHYFLQTIPPFAILGAIQFHAAELKPAAIRLSLIFVLFLFIRIPFVPLEMFGSGDYARVNEIVGNYIRKNSTENDRIFIWGWSQGVYAYSKREPASRFISADFLTGRSPSQNEGILTDTSHNITPGSWGMLIEDFERHLPLYIINTSPGNYHDYRRYPLENYPWLKNLVNEKYLLETVIGGMSLYRRIGS